MRRLLVLVGLAATMCVAPAASASASAPLTNLAHLDFLGASVTPPAQARHTTYRLASEPAIGMLWVYANHNDDGTYTPVGGGAYHSDTNIYDQGAYDADDIARAAVVYLRHWRQFGDAHSRDQAYQLLRGLTYLQTASGPHAGNVVLWMQPDGTLNPSALPKETPDPSDSANSYWLARTIWALGDGYAAFASSDASFATFLRARLDLALDALSRGSLSKYGQHHLVDGVATPAWLIVDGADASGEAALGLSAFVAAGGSEARRPLAQLAAGIAALGTPAGPQWPYGAIFPSALSRSTWHAWAGLAPAGLASASVALETPSLAVPALNDSASFDPRLLRAYGPINGLTPAPTDRSSIAYGVDSRVESLIATARATGRTDLLPLAGRFAAWYFGNNPARQPMYDPSTGVTYDGVSADGVINLNSGAESTIHGLLSMLALDASPRVAAVAQSAPYRAPTGVVVEAEAGAPNGATVRPAPPGNAESSWSGGRFVRVHSGSVVTWSIAPSPRPRTLEAVVNQRPGAGAHIAFLGIGAVDTGGGGKQGDSPVAGRLVPLRAGVVPANATAVVARVTGATGDLDALLLTS